MSNPLRKDDHGRECSNCQEYKLWSEYNKGHVKGYRSECRECQKRAARQYKRDKARHAENTRRWRAKQKEIKP